MLLVIRKLSVLLIVLMGIVVHAQDVYVIKADKAVATIQPTMWGVFFEDINMGADGGIYAELVKNRSFEFAKPLMGWKVEQKPATEGAVTILNRGSQHTNNPRYLRVKAINADKKSLAITNEGFRGMGIKKDAAYDFSLLYHLPQKGLSLHIELFNAKDDVIGEVVLHPETTGDAWRKLSASFTATTTEPKAKLRIWFEGTGTIDLDMISLFPHDTWKQRPGGLRADMVQLLADLKPGFIRFPGGCIVEGTDLANRYQWKKTVGPVDERPININRWNTEFAHRLTPDYYQTAGLGFFEYFQLAEDIGAAPLPILNCGMACQFNTAELTPLDQLDPYIQDALDLVEFANGAITTKWGKLRSDMGHPKSFNLTMIGIGNENWGPQYLERLEKFREAFRTKYPDIKLVASTGTDPSGERFDLLNNAERSMGINIVDEHFYRSPEWFLENAGKYDNYPRTTTKVFAGEYAAQSERTGSVNNKNNWKTALSEAAFMTGLERNAAIVNMASYAPLFAHVDGWQWNPDLIWVDNLRSYGTPNYYVQQLFSVNKGSEVVAMTTGTDIIAGQDSIYATACVDKKANELVIKIANVSNAAKQRSVRIDGMKLYAEAKLIELQNNDLQAVNTFDTLAVAPKESTVAVNGNTLNYTIKPYSFSVFRLKLK